MEEYVPIILLSSERSGTNLLRAVVGLHSKVASPPPVGIISALADRVHRYLSPLSVQYAEELIEDVIALTKMHLNPWDIELSKKNVLDRIDDVSIWQIFKSVNEIYAKKKGCSFWFSKDPGLFKHIYEIKLHMPDVKFIYMVRDGRDVAASVLRGGIQAGHIFSAACRWSEDQIQCLNALSDPLIKDSVFTLKYEDLIMDPEDNVKKIMNFVGLEYESSQMSFYQDKDVINHSKKSEFWKNLAKPIDPENKEKYKRQLSAKQIEIFESIAWDEMKALGYPLENSVRIHYSTIKKWSFMFSNLVRKKLKRQGRGEEMRKQNERSARFGEVLGRSFHK